MNSGRRVKIVATLGPAVAGQEKLHDLFTAGVDVVRINAAHGSLEDRARYIDDVRTVSTEIGKEIPILFDLKGIKIRTGPLEGDEKVPIARGSRVEVFPEPIEANSSRIGINYPDLLHAVRPGMTMLVSDGLIELLVDHVESDRLICSVGRGGLLLARQGVTLPGARMKGEALTQDDRIDIAMAVKHGVDFLGLSFIDEATDLLHARGVADAHGGVPPGLIAKIERPEALRNVADIARHADGIMVARGDLGVQLPPEKVPRGQKDIINCANRVGVPVITATQMLESMITQPMATRAETSDVANAVWDGTDAVMLSGETAIGLYPIEAVQTMARIILEVERDGPVRSDASQESALPPGDESAAISDAIAKAAFELAESAPVDRIIVFTMTGSSARRVAKYRPKPPIIAVTSDPGPTRRLNTSWGVRTFEAPLISDPDEMFRTTGEMLIEQGLAKRNEHVIIVGSLPMMRVAGRTNLLHIRRLGS